MLKDLGYLRANFTLAMHRGETEERPQVGSARVDWRFSRWQRGPRPALARTVFEQPERCAEVREFRAL